MSDQPPPPPESNRRYQAYIKPGIIVVLVLASLIPLDSIRGLVLERQQTGQIVSREIAQSWGGEQRIAGPILVLPLIARADVAAGFRTAQGPTGKFVLVLPETLTVDGAAKTQLRRRGIYQTPLYTTSMTLSGAFALPDFTTIGIDPVNAIDWNNAHLHIHVSDLGSVIDAPALAWDGTTIPLRAGDAKKDIAIATLPVLSPDPSGWPRAFSFDLRVNGSKSLGLLPIGENSTVSLASDWPHPGFYGTHLPVETGIGADGFRARWAVSHFARRLPGVSVSESEAPDWLLKRIATDAILTRFVTPVDHYLMSERSVKYGLLFVILVSCVLFVFEIVAAVRIHPMQYGMAAAALCLFFLLLLSLSEAIGFASGYLIAAGMTVALLALYVGAATQSLKRGGVLGGLLSIVYGYMFLTLTSEDHALLLGSLLLFAALGLTMLTTRRLDWYDLGARFSGPQTSRPPDRHPA